MSRSKSSEVKARAALDKAVARLTQQRRWQGEWELVDTDRKNRSVSWEQFHDRPNTHIAAIAEITVNGQQWWIKVTYESQGTFADLVAFGMVGTSLPKNKPSLLVCNVDPRTDDKYPWDEDGNTRVYIRSRDDWRKLNSSR